MRRGKYNKFRVAIQAIDFLGKPVEFANVMVYPKRPSTPVGIQQKIMRIFKDETY